MSDFFSDDFTAELKGYFLETLIQESQKFMDLVDENLWKRVRSEVSDQCQAWAVDAKTNEFLFLTQWLENFPQHAAETQNASELIQCLKALKSYAETLKNNLQDSADLLSRFSLHTQNRRETLFLHCRSGDQAFAIPLLNVVEISGGLQLYALPEKRIGLQGVVPFRGDAIPVVSLQDHGFPPVEGRHVYYIICEHEGQHFSLQVTDTEDMVSLRDSDLQDVDNKRFFIKDNKSVMILDLKKLVA